LKKEEKRGKKGGKKILKSLSFKKEAISQFETEAEHGI